MWRKISCNFLELNLDITLASGQSFRWTKLENNDWIGVIENLVFTLKQDSDGNLLYLLHNLKDKDVHENCEVLPPKKRKKVNRKNLTQSPPKNFSEHENAPKDFSEYENVLKQYFYLGLNLEAHYELWSKMDENFKIVAKNYRGIRMLRQNPVENLFSFICSANNNIPRITSMVEKLCSNYGLKIIEFENRTFYSFPSIKNLSQSNVEPRLRELGFGYRAKYIAQAAKFLQDTKPPEWLNSLRQVPYNKAHTELLTLPGVGPKVADCICLMSLDKYDAIPIDTHILQVTLRDYNHVFQLKGAKGLSKKIYQQIGDFYRERFGGYAGWASTVLFVADLKMFKKK